MHWLSDLIFFTAWTFLGALIIYGAYYERDWLQFLFKFPSLAWLRQRYGTQNVRIFTITFGIIWIIFGLRIAIDSFLKTDLGKIVFIGVIIVVLVIYLVKKQPHKSE